MFVNFESLVDTSRVWIYQSNREFLDTEITKINEILTNFIDRWNNHGDGLKSSFIIKYNQFIILAVDEDDTNASGCSIDSSVQVIKKIESEFDVNLFDRMKTAFKIGEHINLVSMIDFQKYVKEAKITKDTIVFNNMVNTKGDFKTAWETEAQNSWHTRFFNN